MTANVIFLTIVFLTLFLAYFRKPIYQFFFKPKIRTSPISEGMAVIWVILFLCIIEGPKQISRRFPFIQGIILLVICGFVVWAGFHWGFFG
jgi:cytosine/uracil/thiamine/allantoin permease